MALVAALRADIHNTSARDFKRHFEASDFLPEAPPDQSVEARARAYIEMGYTPSQAAAMATSTQTREHKLYILNQTARAAQKRKRVKHG